MAWLGEGQVAGLAGLAKAFGLVRLGRAGVRGKVGPGFGGKSAAGEIDRVGLAGEVDRPKSAQPRSIWEMNQVKPTEPSRVRPGQSSRVKAVKAKVK